MKRQRRLFYALVAVLAPVAVLAADPGPAGPSITFEWNARLRHEAVDDDAFVPRADATTLRLRAGVRASFGNGFGGLVEAEGIAAAGAYNSGANARVAHPAIIDPQGVELNQAWIGWTGGTAGEHVGATLGRQRLQFDNQRWIGNSGWRQNEQTFDAFAGDWQITPRLTARYAWLDRVHRISGDDAIDPLARERNLDTQLLNLAWKRGAQQLAGYAYLHEDRDVVAASTATYGLRWTGARLRDGDGWGWTLEGAQQRDHAGNPRSFSHAYWLVEPTFASRGITWRAGWEHLGGNGAHALQAPLGTLHQFNGWADKFGTTPAGGLEDRWLGAGGKFGGGAHAKAFNWNVAWHDYRADVGGRYGTEWNASLGFPVRGPVTGLVKWADYRSDGLARDTGKWWLQLEWAHQ